MNRLSGLCVVVSLGLGGFAHAATTCIMDPAEMKFQEMKNIVFSQGTVDEVRSLYSRLEATPEFVNRTESRPVYFLYDSRPWKLSTSPIISYECEGAYCTKKDFYNAIKSCTTEVGSQCHPLAAITRDQNFCFLKPEISGGSHNFKPFGEEM